MHQLLNCGRRVIRRNGRLTFLVALSLILSCCSDTPTQPARAPRNTFPDYQHISGYVSGVWTKEHNPYVITGEVYVEGGDSLIIQAGVQIICGHSIEVDKGGLLDFKGMPGDPVRFVQNSPYIGGGVFMYAGKFRSSYAVFEGHGKMITTTGQVITMHTIYSEIELSILTVSGSKNDSASIKDCIFAGYRPWSLPSGGAQFSTQGNRILDSMNISVANNLFFTGIGDSSWAIDPEPVVDVWILGKNGNREIKGVQWPGNGNLFGDPKWVKYNFVGPSPAGISDNDYHLQPGSPAIGAASDGTNIGAY